MIRTLRLAAAALVIAASRGHAQDQPRELATPIGPKYAILTPVFFDFDSIVLTDSTRVALENAADILAANPAVVITLVGHTDERGSEAYNLRLGQRRASAVASFLAAHGLPAARMNTTSAGERAPLKPGHDEASWAQNRRVEFRVKGNVPLRLPQR